MKKILPVNLDIDITSECWNFLRLTAIMSDRKFFPWYVEKFNNYLVDDVYHIHSCEFASTEFLGYFDEVLSFQNIDMQNMNYKNDIVKKVIESINNDGYVILYCDRFYVNGSYNFQKEHSMHEVLIYGYDDVAREFNFIDVSINGILWGEHKISFNNMGDAFSSALAIISERPQDWVWLYQVNLPASVFYLDKGFNRKPRLEIFYDSISKSLQGREVLVTLYHNGQLRRKVTRHGTYVYRSFYEDLYNALSSEKKDTVSDEFLNNYKFIINNKCGLILKLNFLNEIGLTSFKDSIMDDLKELCNKLEYAFLLLRKYFIDFEKNTLEKARIAFYEAESLDIKSLTEIMDELIVFMKRRVY